MAEMTMNRLTVVHVAVVHPNLDGKEDHLPESANCCRCYLLRNGVCMIPSSAEAPGTKRFKCLAEKQKQARTCKTGKNSSAFMPPFLNSFVARLRSTGGLGLPFVFSFGVLSCCFRGSLPFSAFFSAVGAPCCCCRCCASFFSGCCWLEDASRRHLGNRTGSGNFLAVTHTTRCIATAHSSLFSCSSLWMSPVPQ